MTRTVPLECSIKLTTGAMLKALCPNMTRSQRALIYIFLALERIKEIKLSVTRPLKEAGLPPGYIEASEDTD